MKRRELIKALALLPLIGEALSTDELLSISENFETTKKMPILFLGHGSPMYAIEENKFTRNFERISKKIPKPNAILCISAHWETKGSFVTAMAKPPTIHDFYGFPKELYEVQYQANGSDKLVSLIKDIFPKNKINLDYSWGLDHGTWSVLKYLYPKADIPVVQLSLDRTKNTNYHYNLGKSLAKLRNKGILIIGSGNIVHNLRQIAPSYIYGENFAHPWANEANEKMQYHIKNNNHKALIEYTKQGKAFNLSIPTPEHYLPLLYILALQDTKDKLEIFNNKTVNGSIAMTSVAFGI